MSRRDSRVQISLRQNDNLLEFESFKKKFLFANKQITKQNCSLSLKIEELNAHISTLYVENLRLRASEIALQAQLRREKEKCHRIMADAESATMDLLNRFGIIRQSYDVPAYIQPRKSQSPDGSPPPQMLCQRPPPRSPSALRLAQLPSVPDIAEDPEPPSSCAEDAPERGCKPHSHLPPSLSRKSRNGTSRLPIPASTRSGSPESADGEAGAAADEMQASKRKRKLMRRPSGLMPAPELGRPPSPVFGSPAQRAYDLSEEEEAAAMQDVEAISARRQEDEREREREQEVKKAKKRSSKGKEDRMSEHDDKDKERERGRDREKEKERERKERKKSSRERDRDRESTRLKDVTNSPRKRRITSSTMDMDVDNEGDIERASPIETIEATSRKAKALLSRLTVDEDEAASKAAVMEMAMHERERQAYLPTPAPSSAATTPAMRDTAALPPVDQSDLGSRERRARKSVNYAEPKLNTKMRRPDPVPQSTMPGQRPSLSLMPVDLPPASESARSSPELDGNPTTAKKKQARSSSSGSGSGSSSVAPAKRKRQSRPDVEDVVPDRERRDQALLDAFLSENDNDDDDDDEGEGEGSDDADDADGEFSDFRGASTAVGGKWANVAMRRKSEYGGGGGATAGGAGGAGATATAASSAVSGTRQGRSSAAAGSGSSRRVSTRDADETPGPAGIRRHSIAV